MKRSRAVNLVLLASAVAALDGCGKRQCVDEHNIVVDDRFCNSPPLFYGVHGYRYYGGGFFSSSVPMGSSVSASGTTRGIFGGAGESAHAGGGGAGE